MHVGSLLSRHAKYSPGRLAVIHKDERLTFAAFNERVNRLANALLSCGLVKGDKVACVIPNCLELLDLYWAVAKIGLVVVPLSPLLKAETVAALVKHSDAVMLFIGPDHATAVEFVSGELSHLRPDRFVSVRCQAVGCVPYERLVSAAAGLEPPDPGCKDEDPLIVIYSSGTTGDPKGIVLTHYARAMYCTLYASAWRMAPESVSLHAGSLVFNGSFMTLMPSFFLGGTFILHADFDAENVLDTIARERVTHMVVVPSQLIAILNSPRFDPQKLQSLEALISLGATLYLPIKERLVEVLPGRFYELYGLAEGFMTVLDRADAPEKLASVGTPPPFFEMRILGDDDQEVPTGEVGEIVGRGPIMMSGYYGRPDLTEKAVVNGWLRSGDLGYVDSDGYLFLVDRKKELIKSGGVSVYPRDIEDVIVQHSAVADAAVFGVPSEKWGETPVAAVVLAKNGSVSAEELKDWINAGVSAKFQRISEVVVMSAFPRNAAGKTLKRAIRDSYLEGVARTASKPVS